MWNTDLYYLIGSILVVTLATLCTRGAYYLVAHKIKIPPRIYQALQFAPIAALTAIIVPQLAPMTPDGTPIFDVRLIAAILAGMVFLKFRNVITLIISGMIFLWLLKGVISYL